MLKNPFVAICTMVARPKVTWNRGDVTYHMWHGWVPWPVANYHEIERWIILGSQWAQSSKIIVQFTDLKLSIAFEKS